jgi:hypothetical protein
MASTVLTWKGKKQRALMLVDTGATRTFLLASLADLLSLDISSEIQTAQAGGGTLKVRRAKVGLSLEEPAEGGRIGRTHILDPVLVVEEGALPFPVLGRKPFLRWYDLKLSEFEQEFSLHERA